MKSVRMRENTDQKNPEYGFFSRSAFYWKTLKFDICKGNSNVVFS